MELTIYDRDLNEIGMIEKFKSLLWNRRFSKCGDFTLTCNLDERNLALLEKQNLIMLRDGEEVGIILYRNLKVDENGIESLQVKGKLSKVLLSRRIIWGTSYLKGSADSCLKTIVKENCIAPSNQARRIPNLLCSANTEIGNKIDYQVSYKNVMEEAENICNLGNIGYGLIFDRKSRKFILRTFNHIDKSIKQSLNPNIIFSRKFDNVATQNYTDSLLDYKNLVLIGGIGEEEKRKLLVVGESSGLDRFEIFNDQRSLSDKDGNGDIISEKDYLILMKEKGNLSLSNTLQTNSFTFENVNQSNIKYLIDYDLGDIVTCIDDKWNIVLNTPIIEVQEVYENGREEVNLIVGNELPTILNKLKKGVI